MANHKSTKKRIKTNEKKRVANKWKVSRLRTELKKLNSFLESASKDEAIKQFPIVQKLLAKLAKTNTMNKATVSRKTSRLASHVAKL